MYDRYCKFRDEKGLTDYKVAKLAGIGQSTLSDWKNGRSAPKNEKLKKILDVLGVSLDAFRGAETPTEPLSANERELLRLFRKLNATGQSDALRRISELIQLGYTADKKGLSSDSDEVTA